MLSKLIKDQIEYFLILHGKKETAKEKINLGTSYLLNKNEFLFKYITGIDEDILVIEKNNKIIYSYGNIESYYSKAILENLTVSRSTRELYNMFEFPIELNINVKKNDLIDDSIEKEIIKILGFHE